MLGCKFLILKNIQLCIAELIDTCWDVNFSTVNGFIHSMWN